MSDIEMACTQAQWSCCLARLTNALSNTSAVKRYTTMTNPKYVHPGWVKLRNKSTLKQIRRTNR